MAETARGILVGGDLFPAFPIGANIFISLTQLTALCERHKVSRTRLSRQLQQVHLQRQEHSRLASTEQLARLHQAGLLVPAAHRAYLCSTASAARALAALHMRAELVQQLLQPVWAFAPSQAAAAGTPAQPLPRAAEAAAPPAPDAAPQLGAMLGRAALMPAAPETLPDAHWEPEQLQGMYILPAGSAQRTAAGPPLEALRVWSTRAVQLNRPRDIGMVAHDTWLSVRDSILRFLGYLLKHEGVAEPSLLHYLNAFSVCRYAKYLVERGVSRRAIGDQVHHAIRVVTWVVASGRLPPGNTPAQAASYLELLRLLEHQLRRNLQAPPPRPVPDQLTPEQLTFFVCQAHERAAVAAQRALQPGGGLTDQEAVHLMYAAMACFFWGFLPPMRPSVVLHLLRPGYRGPCLHPSCQRPGACMGNRLSWLDPERRHLQLTAVHHKSGRHGGGPISFRLPADLALLVRAHLQRGVPVMARCSEQRPPWVFFHHNSHKQLIPQQASQAFVGVFPRNVQHLAPSPQQCRAAFVGERRRPGAGAGPSEEGAAAIMGHQAAMWSHTYDRMHRARQVQAAADGMAAWRQGLAERSQQPPLASQTADADLDMGSSSSEDEGCEMQEGSTEEEEDAPLVIRRRA